MESVRRRSSGERPGRLGMSKPRERTPMPRRTKPKGQRTPIQGLPGGGSTAQELARAIRVHAQRRQTCLEEQERLRKELWAILPEAKTSYALLDLEARMEQQGQWALTLEHKQLDLERRLWRIQNQGLPLPPEKEERDDERAAG
jgi:hypothetical protein